MMKYIVMEAYPLNDQYECEAYRMPVCATDDPEQWWLKDDTLEVYEILDDGRLRLVKPAVDVLPSGDKIVM